MVSALPVGFSPARRAAETNDAGPRMGPASIHHHSTFASRETEAIPRCQFATSEGVLRLWGLLSQDAEQAEHEAVLLLFEPFQVRDNFVARECLGRFDHQAFVGDESLGEEGVFRESGQKAATLRHVSSRSFHSGVRTSASRGYYGLYGGWWLVAFLRLEARDLRLDENRHFNMAGCG